MNGLYKALKQFGEVKTNVKLAKFTTFKIGGPAALMVEVTESEKLPGLLSFLSGEGQEFFILGGGSNLLLPDDGFPDTVVIKIKTSQIVLENNFITAEAGALLGAVTAVAVQNGLTGLEWSAGLPGTVGGAVRGNAGAANGEIKNCLEKVLVWRDGEILELKNSECEFGYRESIFKRNSDVILKAWFKLKPGDKKESLTVMQEILKKRSGRYPKFPSAGSFFKNVPLEKFFGNVNELPGEFRQKEIVPAGWLIDRSGLKGMKIGGAMVSEEHGNFIINCDEATQADILKVVDDVKNRVYNQFKVELKEEVQIISN